MDPLSSLQAVMKINRPAAQLLAGGFLVFAIAIGLSANFVDGPNPLLIALYLIGFSVVIMILTALPGMARTFLAWIVTGVLGAWMILVAGQVLSGNSIPNVPTYRCLVVPFEAGCGTNNISSDALRAAPSIAVPIVEEAAWPSVEPSALITMSSIPDAGEPISANARVWLHYNGLTQAQMITLADELRSFGWKVQDKKGGQVIPAAAGLAQVRYFHTEDEEAALALAQRISNYKLVPTQMSILDLSKSKYQARVDPGHLEVWIGVKGDS